MGGKGEFISITNLKEASPEERERLKSRIIAIIEDHSTELGIIALDPELHAGFRVILQPKNKEPPKKS
jgi:hypothetical protein